MVLFPCYILRSCTLGNTTVLYTQSMLGAYIGQSIQLIGYPGLCFTVEATNGLLCCYNPQAVIIADPDICTCGNLDYCYILTDCTGVIGPINVYTNLNPFVGLSISVAEFPGVCFKVTAQPNPLACTDTIAVTCIVACQCPCYSLADCDGNILPFDTQVNLAAYVGQVVQLDEYGGCGGPCFLVSLNANPCPAPVVVTITLGCVPCPPCNQTCYELIDCITRIPYITLLNPTANGVDLSLIVGQSIGKVCLSPEPLECTEGCWEVAIGNNCRTAISAYVYNTYIDCNACDNSCYGLLNCQTLTIDYIIKYTVPNPHGLPNPNTLSGAVGSLCFDAPVGCITGCYQFQLIPGQACVGSVDWSTVASLTPYQDCFDCLPPCYLLTECAPAISAPITVNNDLSLYVGQVVKICDSLGVCHCYHVELAQNCNGSITIDNAKAGFITCVECNSCGCPTGYTRIGDDCQKITSVPAVLNPIVYTTAPGSVDALYGNLGTNFYNNITPLPFPLTAVGSVFKDAALVIVPSINNIVGVWGGPGGSRLNTVGIWTTVAPNPLNEWIGFSECIDIPTTGTYCIGIGGDDAVRIKIDGVLVVLASTGLFDFNYWHVFEINLTAGTHVIVLEGINTSAGAASFGAEIYNVNSLVLQGYTTSAEVQLVTIFTTFTKRGTPAPFQTGENSGYSCPSGYTYNDCGAPSCSLIETVPYVDCARTFLVTDCEGEEAPFLTNTDLSAYVGSTYKTCIPEILYSTTCFILKDCNRLAPDIVTNTDLNAYLWQVVNVQGYSGSCFIVTGVPAGDPCVGAVPVVATPPLMGACDCQGAQAPWFPRCYCVTVEEVTPTVATDFTGVFGASYNTCEDCLRICYTLTDCQDAVDPVNVCNDLAEYVGQVIKIEGCGDICWIVSIATNCDNYLAIPGKITPYVDCPTCLPPIPPVPPLELHLRKIKPGYNSPNSCVTTSFIENINCNFAQQVYNEMLVTRYGITVCCEDDINTWDIKKQLLDYTLLVDPSLCKSTLCCCPAPCLIDVVFTLLPFCGAPVIVSLDFNLPCPAPVLIDVTLDVPITPAECFCYSVAYVGPLDITIHYIDCCCQEQTMMLLGNQLPPGITAVCSITPPITYDLGPGPCGCPPGFTYNLTSGLCESIIIETPTLVNPILISGITTTRSSLYTIWGAVLYPDITAVTYPITGDPLVGIPTSPPGSGFLPYFSYPQLLDGALVPLVPTGGILPVSGNLTWGWDNVGAPPPAPGRLNVAGIWGALLPDFEIEFCVDILTTKTYILGAAADDAYQITIDGVLMVDTTTAGFGFFSWALFPITLTAGVHTFKLKGVDTGLNFGLAFEIYDATFPQLQAVASPAALTPYIIFTTSSLIGRNVTTGPGTGYSCNIGCTLNSCGVTPVCECITTAPYVPCLDVTNVGLCGEALLCNPPPPQVCSCWQIFNPTNAPLGFSINVLCPTGPFGFGQTGIIAPGLSVYACSIAPPTGEVGLVITNNGDCGTYCGPIPAVCVCYLVQALQPCDCTYTNCSGNAVIENLIAGDNYICGYSMPIVNQACALFVTITATAADCALGQCAPPVMPCVCYVITVPFDGIPHDVDMTDCTTHIGFKETFPVGGVYYRCSETGPVYDPSVTVVSTPLNCGLGECIAP